MGSLRFVLLLTAALAWHAAPTGPLRERLAARAQQRQQVQADSAALPPGVKVLRDVAYGSDARQRLDVYLPPAPKDAPLILMVHGGAWSFGDKNARGVVANKVAHWVPQGFIVVCINNRLLPQAAPLDQAADVASALALVQDKAAQWGGARDKIVLMGHSAGAHLVALLASKPELAGAHGAAKWLGTVALDSAALDVEHIMRARHLPLYDRAFGADPLQWKAASPLAQLERAQQPLLAVCSSRRTDSCAQAQRYAAKANTLGMRVQVFAQDLSHEEINAELGRAGAYTDGVDAFLGSVDAALARLLPTPTSGKP
jgi:arylformamidase